MSTEAIEERLRAFVADLDEPDWDDVRARAGKPQARVPRRRLVLALGICIAAALAAFLSGAFSSTHGGTAGLGPGPHFNPLELQFQHEGSRLTSIDVTVNAATLGGTVVVRVVQGVIDETHSGKMVFQESAPMTDVTSPVSGPPGLELLSTWSGTLSPSDWTGGCQDGPYEITVQVTPAVNPTNPNGPPPNGEEVESGSFSCSAWVPFT